MKRGLYANINRRKKKGISRSKKKSTISAKAYSFMKVKLKQFVLDNKVFPEQEKRLRQRHRKKGEHHSKLVTQKT